MEETMESLVALTDHVNECNKAAENESILSELEAQISGLDFVRIFFFLCYGFIN